MLDGFFSHAYYVFLCFSFLEGGSGCVCLGFVRFKRELTDKEGIWYYEDESEVCHMARCVGCLYSKDSLFFYISHRPCLLCTLVWRYDLINHHLYTPAAPLLYAS